MPRIAIDGIGEVDIAPEFMDLPREQQNAVLQQFAASRAPRASSAPAPTTMREPDFYRPDDYQEATRQVRSFGDSAGAMTLAGLPPVTVPDQERRGLQSAVSEASKGTMISRTNGLPPAEQQATNDPPAQSETSVEQSSMRESQTADGRKAFAPAVSYARRDTGMTRASFDKIRRDVGQPQNALDGVGAGDGQREAANLVGSLRRDSVNAASAPPRRVGEPDGEAVDPPKFLKRDGHGRERVGQDLAFLESESASYVFQNYVNTNRDTHLHTPDNSISVVASGPVTRTASGGYITSSTVHAYIGGEFRSYTPTERGGGAISVTPVFSGRSIVDFVITDYVSN